MSPRPNGRHRAEVAKLVVHGRARGRGLARQLMSAVEDEARALGRTLLVLDTVAGSPAERLYRSLGYAVAGGIPDYARQPDGPLQANTILWRTLPPAGAITIAPEPPRQPEIVELFRQLDSYCAALYPVESNHFVDVESLCGPDFRFFVARRGREALGCGALRVDREGYGEVKRMFVLPSARGLKLGRRLLARLEAQARHDGLTALRLETGTRQPEALGLYRAAGFTERGPFGDYREDPWSVFMEKSLA